ncbi:putative AC transposase [Nymphaea thermarum]|nr:putative AC transposase [Nymphaea thermarum]
MIQFQKICDSAKYVRGSPKRLHAFKQCVKAMSLDDKKGLNYDVPTRWISTFIMLRDALLFEDVFQHLASCDPSYTCLPSEDEWSHASNLCQFLKDFYDVTNLFFATKQVTTNLVFEEIVSIYHHLYRHRGTSNEHIRALTCKMQEKATIFSTNLVFEEIVSIYHHLYRHRGTSNEHIRALTCKMQEKFDKYFKGYNILFAIAVVLDPRFKLSYLKYLLGNLDKPDAIVKYELYAEYRNMYEDSDV